MMINGRTIAEIRYTIKAYLEPRYKQGWYDGYDNPNPEISKVQDEKSIFINTVYNILQ